MYYYEFITSNPFKIRSKIFGRKKLKDVTKKLQGQIGYFIKMKCWQLNVDYWAGPIAYNLCIALDSLGFRGNPQRSKEARQ